MPAAGGMGIVGILLFPVSIGLMMLRNRGPVSKFVQAGAVSSATARRPGSLGVSNRDLLDWPQRKGVLRATEDGRFWVDLPRRRFWLTLELTIIIGLFAGAGMIILAFWLGWFGAGAAE